MYGIAATALDRANRIAPGDASIVGELLMCLESQLLYGAGSDIAEASGLVGVDPVVTYLAGPPLTEFEDRRAGGGRAMPT